MMTWDEFQTEHKKHIQAEQGEFLAAALGRPSTFRGNPDCSECAAIRQYRAFGGKNHDTGGGLRFGPDEDYLPGDLPGDPSY